MAEYLVSVVVVTVSTRTHVLEVERVAVRVSSCGEAVRTNEDTSRVSCWTGGVV